MRIPSLRIISALALAFVAPLAPLASAGELELKVRILHTADLHGALAGWDDWQDRPAAKGLERVASLVAAARAKGDSTLLLDAGDALHGSQLERVWREGPRRAPEPVVAAMNALGYDALAVGNHEFDAGRESLESAIAAAHFPFLAANVVDTRTGRPAFGTSLVREFEGARIGIIGLTTPAAPMLMDSVLCAGLTFLDPLEVARTEIARLRGAERCQAVIALVHMGLEREP